MLNEAITCCRAGERSAPDQGLLLVGDADQGLAGAGGGANHHLPGAFQWHLLGRLHLRPQRRRRPLRLLLWGRPRVPQLPVRLTVLRSLILPAVTLWVLSLEAGPGWLPVAAAGLDSWITSSTRPASAHSHQLQHSDLLSCSFA